MIELIVLWSGLGVAAVAAGLVAGSGTGNKSRHFGYGLVVTVLCGLVVLSLACSDPAPVTRLIEEMLKRAYMPDPSRLVLAFSHNIVSEAMVLKLTGTVVLLAVFGFIISFICQRKTGNPYIACGGVFFFAVIFCLGLPWGFYGLGAFIALFQGDLGDFPDEEGGLAVLLLTMVMLAVWLIYELRSEKSGWKRLLIQSGIGLGIYVFCWLAALAVIYPYGCHVRSKLVKTGVKPWSIANEFPDAAKPFTNKIQQFRAGHRKMALPLDDVYYWKTGNSQRALVPQDKREYTLKLFDTPEFEAFCAAYEDVLKNGREKGTVNFPWLNHARNYARVRAGRASLFSETGQDARILPELMAIKKTDAETLTDSQSLIEELVRVAVRRIWYIGVLKLGPDGPEYAPVYRQALALMKSEKIQVPSELGYGLYLLDSSLRRDYSPYELRDRQSNAYGRFLGWPVVMALCAESAAETLALEDFRVACEQNKVLGELPEDRDMAYSIWMTALKSKASKAQGMIAMALKLYRSEKGEYPAKLSQLVPEYLDAVPVEPHTGKALIYESDGKTFKLGFADREYFKFYDLEPEKTY